MFGIYSMKPLQIFGPWNDGLTAAHPSLGKNVFVLGGVKGIGGNVPL